MYKMLPFDNGKKSKRRAEGAEDVPLPEQQSASFNLSNVPKEMDVYWKPFSEYLPDGIDYDLLSDKDKKLVKDRYRFAFLRPGKYQSITGIGGRNGQMYS